MHEEVRKMSYKYNEESTYSLLIALIKFGEKTQDLNELLALMRETALIYKPAKLNNK